jgi:hypothetical protein
MDIHDNARTTRHSRMLMVQRLTSGWTVATGATAQGVHPRQCASGATDPWPRAKPTWRIGPPARTAARTRLLHRLRPRLWPCDTST